MKHTPRPWKYDTALADGGSKETPIYGKSSNLFEPVCIIPHDDITDEGYQEVKHNAALISAAPDLLVALEGLLREPTAEQTVAAAKRAIKKAQTIPGVKVRVE